MTVAELKEKLSQFDDHLLVMFCREEGEGFLLKEIMNCEEIEVPTEQETVVIVEIDGSQLLDLENEN